MTRDLLSLPHAPWVILDHVTPDEAKLLPEALYANLSATPVIRQLRGAKMRTNQGLMDEFGAALQFFEGFGENWHALLDCLRYLNEWLPGDCYLLVVIAPQHLLERENGDQLYWFLRTLDEVGEWWSQPITGEGQFDRPAIPFHAVLQVRESEGSSLPPALAGLPVLGRT